MEELYKNSMVKIELYENVIEKQAETISALIKELKERREDIEAMQLELQNPK